MSKYHNLPCLYAGRRYHSIAEADYARSLDLRKSASDIRDWRPQLPIPLTVNGVTVCRYVVDFAVYHLDGSTELVEVKGHWTEAAKLKRKLFQALYPDAWYTVVQV